MNVDIVEFVCWLSNGITKNLLCYTCFYPISIGLKLSSTRAKTRFPYKFFIF